MARTILCSNTEVVGLTDFIEHVESNIDRNDPESIASAAAGLRAVTNNRQLILPALHRQMRERFAHQRLATTQVIVLGGGSDFYIRADVWPTAQAARQPQYRDQASAYRSGSVQNFTSLSTAYIGSGLIHDLYAFSPSRIIGRVGEPTPLTCVEQIHLTTDKALLLLPQGEVVQRVAPETLSISISLLILKEVGDFYTVDVANQKLAAFAPQIPGTRRAALLRLAGMIGDQNTRQYLDDLALEHACARTRIAAYEACVTLTPERAPELWERAAADASPLVREEAKRQMFNPTS